MILTCPHCQDFILILEEDLGCRVFRHATYKSDTTSNQNVNPHASERELEFLLANNLIYGCGKPFLVNAQGVAEICAYI